MLHGILNEQGNCLDIRDAISENHILFFICLPINLWPLVPKI